MKRLTFSALLLLASGLMIYTASLEAQETQERVLFQDNTAQPTPVTTALDARLKALEEEALLSRPALDEHAKRIEKIESSMKSAKEKEEQKKIDDAKKEKKWFEKVSFRGYTQVRINEVFEVRSVRIKASYFVAFV
jgi:hypothetical protein